jgi:hypothetical protein
MKSFQEVIKESIAVDIVTMKKVGKKDFILIRLRTEPSSGLSDFCITRAVRWGFGKLLDSPLDARGLYFDKIIVNKKMEGFAVVNEDTHEMLSGDVAIKKLEDVGFFDFYLTTLTKEALNEFVAQFDFSGFLESSEEIAVVAKPEIVRSPLFGSW